MRFMRIKGGMAKPAFTFLILMAAILGAGAQTHGTNQPSQPVAAQRPVKQKQNQPAVTLPANTSTNQVLTPTGAVQPKTATDSPTATDTKNPVVAKSKDNAGDGVQVTTADPLEFAVNLGFAAGLEAAMTLEEEQQIVARSRSASDVAQGNGEAVGSISAGASPGEKTLTPTGRTNQAILGPQLKNGTGAPAKDQKPN